METHGLPLSESIFLTVQLERDPMVTASLVQAFSHKVSIVSFVDVDLAWNWLHANPKIDLFVFDEQAGRADLLEKLRADSVLFLIPVILTAKVITTKIREKALMLQALDVFSTESDKEKLKFRIDYLIQKKAYLTDVPQLVDMDLPNVQIPFWKRSLDIIVSLSVLAALAPVLIIAAMLIFVESPGPVLYRSKRVGKDFRVFNMYKFRSMHPNADKMLASMAAHNIYNTTKPTEVSDEMPKMRCENCQRIGVPCERPLFLRETQICELDYLQTKKSEATFMKFRNDPRVTRMGNLLRNSSIDELPQLFNILRGDMSLVGNRPLPFYEAERLTTTNYAQRFAAPAGLTGLWQVTKRGRSQGVVSDLERIQFDIEYAENFSFRTDLAILLKTVTAVWQKENV